MATLPDNFRPLLWSYNFSATDPERHKKVIITQTINYGDLHHWRWLVRFYGKEVVQGGETKIDTSASSTLPTADWKTYRSEEYGFEVKYPTFGNEPISKAESYDGFDSVRLGHRAANENISEDFSVTVFLNVVKNPAKLSINDWFKNIVHGVPESNMKLDTLPSQWTHLEVLFPLPDSYDAGPICSHYLMSPSQKFGIVFCGGSETSRVEKYGYGTREKKEILYDQILTTFKEFN